MATKAAATKQEVAVIPGAAPPAALANRLAADAGKGVSTRQEDNLVPLVYVLQPLSPQVDKRGPEYIQGAEPGDLWLRNSSTPIIKGDEGLLFQPCFFTIDWVEWVPRTKGGGYIARYPDCPTDVVKTPDQQNPNKIRLMRPNGNEMIETRYHIGFVYLPGQPPQPYVIPFSSTGHTVSRQWMFMMNGKQNAGQPAASFACFYRLKTKQRTKAAGTWFTIDPIDAGWVQTEIDYDRGSKLYDQFAAGEKVVEAPAHQEAAETGDHNTAAM